MYRFLHYTLWLKIYNVLFYCHLRPHTTSTMYVFSQSMPSHTTYLKPVIIPLSFRPKSLKWSFPLKFSDQNFAWIIYLTLACCMSHPPHRNIDSSICTLPRYAVFYINTQLKSVYATCHTSLHKFISWHTDSWLVASLVDVSFSRIQCKMHWFIFKSSSETPVWLM
jgi:hypothetical protein